MPNINAALEDLFADLEQVLSEGKSIPFMSGKTLTDTQEALAILDEIRQSLPEEIDRSRAVVADREKILADARNEANAILKTAKLQAENMIAREEVVRLSQQKAAEIAHQSQEDYKQRLTASYDYVEEFLRQSDESMAAILTELRRTRQSVRDARRKELSGAAPVQEAAAEEE